MEAEALYVVRFWVHPTEGHRILHWLDTKHFTDVASQPGFLWARRAKLEQDADDGWLGYIMIYCLESRAALERYFNSDAPPRYAIERKPMEHLLRVDRMWGSVDLRHN